MPMSMMKRLCLIAVLLAAPAYAVTVDRIAAVIDRQVLTVSEVNQIAEVGFFPRVAGRSEDDYRHDILEALIAQALRLRDVERFGPQEIPKDSIEARLVEIQHRFASPAELDAAVARAELTPDELRPLLKRQLRGEGNSQGRLARSVFVSTEALAASYTGPCREQRGVGGLPVPPLNDVREEIRTLIRSRQLDQ